LVIREQVSTDCHEFERMVVDEGEELRKLVGVGNRCVDLLQDPALDIEIRALRDVDDEHGPRRFRAEGSVWLTLSSDQSRGKVRVSSGNGQAWCGAS
jgi:hypothetical protein